MIHQGDIFWVELDEPTGSEPGYRHPHVVIQNNIFNRSRINTVVICALTSNLKRAEAPGNILLEKGEADLPKQSVVVVSQIFTEKARKAHPLQRWDISGLLLCPIGHQL